MQMLESEMFHFEIILWLRKSQVLPSADFSQAAVNIWKPTGCPFISYVSCMQKWHVESQYPFSECDNKKLEMQEACCVVIHRGLNGEYTFACY